MVATVGIAATASVALALATHAPLLTTAVALMAFGVVHNAFELRYVFGRFPRLLAGPYLLALGGLITAIVLARLVGSLYGGGWSVRAEIVVSYVLVATAVLVGLRRRPAARVGAVAVLAVAALVSLRSPDHHVVVTHLHNLIPLAFLWELSAAMRRPARAAFRAVQLAWVVVVPALLLAGWFDAPLRAATTAHVALGDAGTIAPFTSPPSAWGTTAGLRLLAVFAFLQLMHFVVWVFVIPRCTPAATRTFEARVRVLRGRRLAVAAVAGAAVLAVVFLLDYGEGRSAYSALASYHAYLELPVLIGVVLAAGRDLGA